MKKIVLGLLIIVICFTVTGCFSKQVETNKEFDKYTGIYKLDKMELKIVHYKNTILLIMERDKIPFGSTMVDLKDNKFIDLNCEFELDDNEVIIKTNQKDIPKGVYKKIKSYTTKEIYKDYIGDISLLNEYNGIYENEITKIYTVKTNKDVIKFAYKYKDSNINIAAIKETENHYSADLFGNKYDLNFDNETLDLKVDKQGEKELTGKYTKKDKMKAADIIKVFAFDDYK